MVCRLLWLLCLTGSITCAPVGKVQSRPPYTLYDAPAAGSLGYTVGQYGAPAVGFAVGQYGSPGGGLDRYAVGQYQTGPTQFNTQSGINNDENKPVFSDVSGLEPVYSISSRSRYHKGRAAFAQTRYTATESLGLSVPLFPYTSQTDQTPGSGLVIGELLCQTLCLIVGGPLGI
uniref:Uncharacterized protein n=1 Tax=Neolamprologus brichardi TaxID=32507 RepID=A0A3Q4H7K2_NEOBR